MSKHSGRFSPGVLYVDMSLIYGGSSLNHCVRCHFLGHTFVYALTLRLHDGHLYCVTKTSLLTPLCLVCLHHMVVSQLKVERLLDNILDRNLNNTLFVKEL